jgi:sRNA-binding regulator protein Hfq
MEYGQRTPVDLHLLNAEVIEGAIITSISRYAFVLRVIGQERCVMKHAIAWAAKTQP